jgi:hypothetical protein
VTAITATKSSWNPSDTGSESIIMNNAFMWWHDEAVER